MRSAFAGQSGTAVILRVRDAKIVAAYNRPALAHRLATPGSSIKPFTLNLLLESGLLKSSERIGCKRALVVDGMRLRCSHAEGPGSFDSEEALAFSCNSFFTEASKRLPPEALERSLRSFGFEQATSLMPGEASGHIAIARTRERRELLAIGAAGIEVTPLELALAYRRVALWQASPTPAQRVVLNGLTDAITYGLGHLAQSGSLKIAGKTGTASNPGNLSTHGWFAGFAPADAPEIVLIVYVEHGRGGVEAAAIAGRILESWERLQR